MWRRDVSVSPGGDMGVSLCSPGQKYSTSTQETLCICFTHKDNPWNLQSNLRRQLNLNSWLPNLPSVTPLAPPPPPLPKNVVNVVIWLGRDVSFVIWLDEKFSRNCPGTNKFLKKIRENKWEFGRVCRYLIGQGCKCRDLIGREVLEKLSRDKQIPQENPRK